MRFNIIYNRCYIVTTGFKNGSRETSSHGHSNSCVKQSSSHKTFLQHSSHLYVCVCVYLEKRQHVEDTFGISNYFMYLMHTIHIQKNFKLLGSKSNLPMK